MKKIESFRNLSEAGTWRSIVTSLQRLGDDTNSLNRGQARYI